MKLLEILAEHAHMSSGSFINIRWGCHFGTARGSRLSEVVLKGLGKKGRQLWWEGGAESSQLVEVGEPHVGLLLAPS